PWAAPSERRRPGLEIPRTKNDLVNLLVRCNGEILLHEGAKMGKAYHPDDLPFLNGSDISLDDKIASAIKGYGGELAQGGDVYNIAYTEGLEVYKDDDGLWKATPNDNRNNQFNDSRLLLQIIAGKAVIVDAWEATTEP